MTPRLIRTVLSATIVVLMLVLPPAALAVDEQGDAGELMQTAQNLGDAGHAVVSGTFTSGADVDLYRLCLADGLSFSATTVGGTTLDTQMFLFDSAGLGVYANDDWSGSRGSQLPANHRFSPRTGGDFFLAVGSYNRDPQSAQGEIFLDSFNRFVYPDGVVPANSFGAGEPLAGWAGRAPGGTGVYRIALTGTRSCLPPDETAPVVNLRSPVSGARVARGAEVRVDFSCSDEGGSGLASCAGSVADGELLDTSALGELAVTVSARDGAGNETVVTHWVTVVDETAPEIEVAAPADGAVFALGEAVEADYSCADEPGGSGVASCEGTVPAGGPVDTASAGLKSFTVTATDAAGNSSTRTVSYTVADLAGPSILIVSPADGAVFRRGQNVRVDFSCEDQPGGAGVTSCVGSVPDGARLDTSRAGPHTFSVTATDGAGNSTTRSVTYSVSSPFSGFLWPVRNPPKVNRWMAGVPVVIRFSLDGYRGRHPEAPGYPRSTLCDGGDAQPVLPWRHPSRSTFGYDTRHDQYWLIWRTQPDWAGSCREFVLQLDDGSEHTAKFQFARR